jgi:hypothetical protein
MRIKMENHRGVEDEVLHLSRGPCTTRIPVKRRRDDEEG